MMNEEPMTYTKMADRIIQLADRLQYGLDIDFTGQKPIAIKPGKGRHTKKFNRVEDALAYLEGRMAMISG
jgi:hypothetical protein